MADTKITLIVSDEKEPTVRITPGMQVKLVEISAQAKSATAELTLGTLCGYETTYCVALVEEQ